MCLLAGHLDGPALIAAKKQPRSATLLLSVGFDPTNSVTWSILLSPVSALWMIQGPDLSPASCTDGTPVSLPSLAFAPQWERLGHSHFISTLRQTSLDDSILCLKKNKNIEQICKLCIFPAGSKDDLSSAGLWFLMGNINQEKLGVAWERNLWSSIIAS